MAGLFMGRASACNWCQDDSSPSESDPSVISSSSVSVSEYSLATGCDRCSDGILPRRYRIPVVSTIYCPGNYTKTFIVEKINGNTCQWQSWDRIGFEPPYIDGDRARKSPGCTVFGLHAIQFSITTEFLPNLLLQCLIFYSKDTPSGVQSFFVTYQLEVTPDGAGEIDCLTSRVLTRPNTLDSNGEEDGFPLSVTVSPV